MYDKISDMPTMFQIVFGVQTWVYVSYQFSYLIKMFDSQKKFTFARHVCSELAPFIPVLAAIDIFSELMAYDTLWSPIMILCDVFWVHMARTDKDNDDRWKRRRKKASEAVVRVMGQKLVVVPVGAGA